MKQPETIIWDWNGTLLDDLAVNVETINAMLHPRALPVITRRQYRGAFAFPVRPYYASLGFDLSRENWNDIATEYTDIYASLSPTLALAPGALETLAALHRAGIRQYILSALREDLLADMLQRFKISQFFHAIRGSANTHADGKIAHGRELLARHPIRPATSLIIGDTLHDAEVAETLGIPSLLYTRGHNSASRLRQKSHTFHQMERLPALLA
ncbi:MAG: HAD family hydrolase [Odoribacteraceae bacterium]|jgi:phosphoglycolate phosphatase|nr:HAD family hydrolase [Odoribacteraceae bacterium]